LEDKEGSDHVFLVDIKEVRNWNAHFVWAPNQVGLLQFKLSRDAFAGLVVLDSILHWIGDLLKALFV
jgi:hypothetical protein